MILQVIFARILKRRVAVNLKGVSVQNQRLIELIDRRLDEVQQQIRALQEEVRELESARFLMLSEENREVVSTFRRKRTHTDYILESLRRRPQGGTSDEVINWVRDDFEIEIPQSSISSQLSRAKARGLVSLEKGTRIWKATENYDPDHDVLRGSW